MAEAGSLLPEALRHMELQRQLEDQDYFCGGGISGDGLSWESAHASGGSADAGIAAASLVQNAVIISVYPLDAVDDDAASAAASNDTNTKEAMRRVATLGHIINDIVLPDLRTETFRYPWHLGGDGLAFGAECRSHDSSDGTVVPHLRAVLRYGHSIADEWCAVAVMYHMMHVLKTQHNTRVAVEMIDADDGQFLLIEAADALPDWVDELGVDGMRHRVWLLDGSVRLLPPSERGKNDGGMSQVAALHSLQSSPSNGATVAPSAVQDMIMTKIQPFLDALQSRNSRAMAIPSAISDHMHRAAMVLPLDVAVLIRNQPHIIPAAVHAFCRNEGQKKSGPETQSQARRDANDSGNNISGATNGPDVAFERLVTVVVTLSRTTYAVLLTGEGLIPPPFPVPKKYRSVELNRMRRRLKNDALTHRFRHALEGGVRLTIGLKHLLVGQSSPVSRVGAIRDGSNTHQELTIGDKEQRVCLHWSRLGNELGLGGEWISETWLEGPNGTSDDKSYIDAFLKCPTYRPEMTRGGLWPLSHPRKTAQEVARELFRSALRSGATAADFPMTREDEVDGDKWIDLDSPNSAEELMKEIASANGKRENRVPTSEPDGHQIQDMLGGLQSFLNTNSDFDGVRRAKETTIQVRCDKSILDKEIKINPHEFIGRIHRSLKAATSTSSYRKGGVDASKDEMRTLFYADDYRMDNDGGSDSQSDDDGGVNTGERGDRHSTETLQGAMVSQHYDWSIEARTAMSNNMNLLTAVIVLSSSPKQAAMDLELRSTKVERNGEDAFDIIGDERGGPATDDDLSTDITAVSNILKSLDAQAGASGPVSNVLGDLGLNPSII